MAHRRFTFVLPLVLLSGLAVSSAQEAGKPLCACKPREVGASGSRKAWDGYDQGVRWHFEVDEAMKIARAEGKLVFWYHVVGDLDKEGCWAAGHSMRTVTFSNPDVVKLLGEKFVCAWLNKRPQIKFIDGRTQKFPENYVLPNGVGASNVTSIFADADGTVLHAMPGMLNVASFQKHMEFALYLHARLGAEGYSDERRAEIYSQAHRDAQPGCDVRGFEKRADGVEIRAHRLLEVNTLSVDKFPLSFFDNSKEAVIT